ncbi:MAG: hypothetical protein ACI9R3_002551 [Verrucomicrobiales bacterium]|jgi:hypothetical protein
MLIRSLILLALSACISAAAPLTFEGTSGAGKGKHIVFIANDHEYLSEETCPLIAKILAKHHGFRCTVLFGVDKKGFIKAGDAGIPDMEALNDADLLVFFTRFMNLPDGQVDLLVDYFERGGPVVGIRTSTHCFNGQAGKWAKLNFNYKGEDYRGGLGEQIFGNTWHKERGQSHYGTNHKLGCRITPAAGASHPILAGVRPMHAYSGAYKSQPPVGATRLLDVQVLNTFWPSDDFHTESPAVNAGWTRDFYIAPSETRKDARVVYTSFGASEDILDENARRFLVNSCFWASGMDDKIQADLNVSIVGDFKPSPYTTGAFFRAGVKPSDLAGWDSQVMPGDSKFGGLDNPTKNTSARIFKALPATV